MIDVSFSLHRDTIDIQFEESFTAGITGIYGPSGSGKTTLLQTIAGLVRPDTGHVSIQSRTLFDSQKKVNIPVHHRRIGFVFQEGRLFPHMSVMKNLRYGIRSYNQPCISFDELTALLSITHLLHRMPGDLSGGEYQRVALGRALLSAPEILLLDEPFSAVDAGIRKTVIPAIRELHKRTGIPMLIVSHELRDLCAITQQMCIVYNGTCIGHDTYHNLIRQDNCRCILGATDVLNTVHLTIESVDQEKEITVLSTGKDSHPIRVTGSSNGTCYRQGDEISIFIRAQDIALATSPLDTVSLQNQLPGTISSIIPRKSTALCIIDVGFELIAEITITSLERLNIRTGQKIWCLFKSAAIDTIH